MYRRLIIPRSLSVVIIALAAFGGCGGGGEDRPPGPGPSPTPLSLAITPATDFVRLRASEALSAVATMTNGTTQNVTATWSSDNTAIATVDSSGRVTGTGSGQASISAISSGLTAVRSLRVVPDYQGRWSGDHSVPGCIDDGDWRQVGFCQDLLREPIYALGLVTTQSRDTVTGTLDIGIEPPGAIQGSIQMNGDIGLAGTFAGTSDGVPIEVTVSDWQTRTMDNERMSGRFRVTFRAAGVTGSAIVDVELRVFNKTASALAAPAPGSRRTVLSSIRKVLR